MHIYRMYSHYSEIKKMVKNAEGPASDAQKREIEAKLERCRNQENNPNSAQYRTNYTGIYAKLRCYNIFL